MSTQASVANAAAARVWHSLGASRVVCAREMSLSDIARLRQDAPPDLEIEAFAHGAMCMAVSGRCLISSYLTGRSGNKGHCTQPCRWSYQLGTAAFEEFAPPEAPTGFLLEEEKRPGEFFPIEEDDRGTFIMNAKDMNMLAHLRELARAGVDSIKIEGRNKKAFYVASVVGAYRRVLDGEPPAAVADELLAVSHRPYGTGFYFSEAEQAPAYDGYEQETMHVADVAACRDGFLYVLCRNRFAEGDELEILAPHEPSRPLIVRDLHWLSIFGPDNHDEDAPATAGEALARATAADWEAAAVANRSCNLYRIRLAAASDGAASGTSDTSSASDMRDASNVSVMSDTCGASGGSAPCAPSLSAHVSEGSFLRKRTFRRSARHG
ncbi:MAG: U32 family peptidase [Adlercreutzia equolifaciens]